MQISEMEPKKWEKVFCIKDNCIWIGDDRFSQYRTGYLPLEVNVLRNTPKSYHITKEDIFEITLCQSDGKIW